MKNKTKQNKTTFHKWTSLAQYNSKSGSPFWHILFPDCYSSLVVPFNRQSSATSSYFYFPLIYISLSCLFGKFILTLHFIAVPAIQCLFLTDTIQPNSTCPCLKHPPVTSASWTTFVLTCCLPNRQFTSSLTLHVWPLSKRHHPFPFPFSLY